MPLLLVAGFAIGTQAAVARSPEEAPPSPVNLPGEDPEIAALREDVEAAEDASRAAEDAAAAARRRRNSAEAELVRRKYAATAGDGWLAGRRVRRQSAAVRALVEETITSAEAARAARAELSMARRRLRASLFREASRRSAEADAAARAKDARRAAELHAAAARLLAEGASIPRDIRVRDPWAGLDAEIPLTGAETPAELEAIARAYRTVIEQIDQVVEDLAPELDSALDAAVAWERLSRFRGVLERAGAPADPRPELEALRATLARGRELRAEAVAHAESVEALRVRVEAAP